MLLQGFHAKFRIFNFVLQPFLIMNGGYLKPSSPHNYCVSINVQRRDTHPPPLNADLEVIGYHDLGLFWSE